MSGSGNLCTDGADAFVCVQFEPTIFYRCSKSSNYFAYFFQLASVFCTCCLFLELNLLLDIVSRIFVKCLEQAYQTLYFFFGLTTTLLGLVFSIFIVLGHAMLQWCFNCDWRLTCNNVSGTLALAARSFSQSSVSYSSREKWPTIWGPEEVKTCTSSSDALFWLYV